MIAIKFYIMDESLRGVVGIQNMGNTCYCNSTIQILRACHEWNVFCITQDFSHLKDNNNKKILLAYQDIIKSIWSASKPSYIRPTGFLSEIRKVVKGTVYEMFGQTIPNDSHEFLTYLLDNFHEALKEDTNDTKGNQMLGNSEVVRSFFGTIRNTIHCTNCKNNTYQSEIFNSLKIPCDGNTFKDWIQNEIKDSDIEGYQCDNCHTKSTATIYSRIWKLPRNLFITMRRFNPNGTKNMTKCPYDGNNISFSEFFANESDDPSKNWVYELKGISDHHGSHVGGHYNTQFKHPISNEWWKIDDETANKQLPAFSAANYIFLFVKNVPVIS